MTSFKRTADARVAIVGLGYVGLPLAVEFGKHLDTLGFDIDAERIAELKAPVLRMHKRITVLPVAAVHIDDACHGWAPQVRQSIDGTHKLP